MFIVADFTDAELTTLGVDGRGPQRTRSERRAVEATAEAIMNAPARLRSRFLRALLGDQFPIVQACAVAAGADVEHLMFQIPKGSLAPDLVMGYLIQDPSGTAAFVVLAVLEHKRSAYDNVHESQDALPNSWPALWTTSGGHKRSGSLVYQCDGYRGDPARWLDYQPEPSWRLNGGKVDDVLWLLVCEYERDHVPDGWTVLPWAPLISEALAAVRAGYPGALCAGPLLREWIAPSAERLFYAAGSQPFGSLQAAAVAAWNDRHTRITHRHRESALQVGPTGGWLVVDGHGNELTPPHPEARAWAQDAAEAGELLAGTVCPACVVPASQCGHIDVDGMSW